MNEWSIRTNCWAGVLSQRDKTGDIDALYEKIKDKCTEYYTRSDYSGIENFTCSNIKFDRCPYQKTYCETKYADETLLDDYVRRNSGANKTREQHRDTLINGCMMECPTE